MTAAPTPPPAERPDLEAIRARSEAMTGGPWYIVHAQADIAELLDYAEAAERRVAEAEENLKKSERHYQTAMYESLAARLGEVTQERDDWKRVVDQNLDAHEQSEFELGDRLAAAARENERLARQNERFRALEWDTEISNPSQCPWCLALQPAGHEDFCAFAAALAAEPREGGGQ